MSQNLGRLLVDRGVVTVAQVDEALAHQKRSRRPLGETLVDLGFATADAIVEALGQHYGVPATRINAYTIDPAVLAVLPERLARKHTVLPLFKVGTVLTVATADPRNLAALDDLRFATGCDVQPVVALESEIGPAIDRYYREAATIGLPDVAHPVIVEEPRALTFEREEDEDQSAVGLVDRILSRAVADRASDIHLEPQEKALRVRLRVDGVLTEVARLPADLAPAVAARVKVLAGMDIAEHRVPQDGRFTAAVGSRRLDLRASAYPTVWGEKVVLRLLDRAALQVRLPELGMPARLLAVYRDLVRRPEGMILITGPTGSGKTSTLYATLGDLVETGRNITTLENPVEYELEGVNQGQTNDRAGFTFATGLRAILRQDPDVILVGEIRDRETLEVAVEAALTGHLVLSTLHTNSAVASITRLVEMGLEPYLLASTVLAIVAQRLVRRVCQRCARREPLAPEVSRYFPEPPAAVTRGGGCKECRLTGYQGRIGLFEMLQMTDELRRLILRRASEEELAAVNRRNGFASLRDEGLRQVADGTTTLDEVLRATQVRE
jgi:type IV pilus assembly protein PilB